jgi:pimeloyl-ACP methyl ester carboxylesterase
MDALRIKAAVVVGASSGGQVALQLTLDHPERILGLVLLGSPLRLSDKPAVREAWDSTLSLLRAAAELDDEARRRVFYAFLALANQVAVADQLPLGDVESIPRAKFHVRKYHLSLHEE